MTLRLQFRLRLWPQLWLWILSLDLTLTTTPTYLFWLKRYHTTYSESESQISPVHPYLLLNTLKMLAHRSCLSVTPTATLTPTLISTRIWNQILSLNLTLTTTLTHLFRLKSCYSTHSESENQISLVQLYLLLKTFRVFSHPKIHPLIPISTHILAWINGLKPFWIDFRTAASRNSA